MVRVLLHMKFLVDIHSEIGSNPSMFLVKAVSNFDEFGG